MSVWSPIRWFLAALPATAVVCFALTASAAPLAEYRDLKTPDDLPGFFQTYYLKPRPELISRAIELLPSSAFNRPTGFGPVVGFFSEVFAANPDRLAEWQPLIEKLGNHARAPLDRALYLSKNGGALKIDDHAPELNDVYWAAYFASGNQQYIKRLVEQLRFDDERDNLKLYVTGATAKWSLASNAQSHVQVRSTLEVAKLNSDRRTQELIDELLSRDPEDLRRDMAAIVAKQRRAGKWN